MGTSQYISLKDAALMTERSQQTIRRLIKANKVKYRKYKTPQGFTYLVEKSSLLHHFQESDEMDDAELVEDFDPLEMEAMESDSDMTPIAPSAYRAPAPSTPPHHDYSSPSHQPYGMHWTPAPPTFHPSHQPPPTPPPPTPVTPPAPATPEPAPASTIVSELIRQHREDKNRLFELLETFQKRILILEEHIRLLEAPKTMPTKRWYHFWKR